MLPIWNYLELLFSECNILSELDLSSFNIINANDKCCMFSYSENLKRVLINKLNIKKIKEKNDINILKI